MTATDGVYDRWSRNPRALRLLYAVAFAGREATFRRRSREALSPSAGEAVLELGCGRGTTLGPLREAVGPDGRVVGVDYSRGMAETAAAAADRWENVHVVRGDATGLGVRADAFDAAYAAMSVSATSDPTAAVATAARCLRPDGRFVALDARPFQPLPLRVLNPLVVPVLRVLTDWNHAADVPAAVEAHFETATVESYNAGTIYVVSGAGPRDNDGRDALRG